MSVALGSRSNRPPNGESNPPEKRRSVHPETRPDARGRLRLLARNRVVRLGRARWTTSSFLLLGVATLLTVVGLTFVASASSVSSLHVNGSSWTVFNRQLIFVVLGLVAMVIATVVPYRVWWGLGPLLFVASAVATTYAALAGVEKNGSRRWIGFGSLLVQPSEFLKFGAVLMFAMVFTHRNTIRVMSTPRFIWRTLFPLTAIAAAPIMLQPDMGTAVIVIVSCAAVVIVAGFPMHRLGPVALAGLTGLMIFAMSADYRRDRVTTFLNPESDPTGLGWHVTQSKLGFATGKLFGIGIGASRSKWGWVPNAHTDFVFAIIGEEVGLVGATLVLALFAGIAVVGFSIVNNARDRFGSLVAAGITTWILAQAVFNMGTVLGLVPVTGVPMPFVSSGGSSFVILGIAFGVLVNISRFSVIPDEVGRRSKRARPVLSPEALPLKVRRPGSTGASRRGSDRKFRHASPARTTQTSMTRARSGNHR
jgi:cell division protein FtsW